MGGSGSKPKEDTQNNGILNGNIINNGVVGQISEELSIIEICGICSVIIQLILLLIVLSKAYLKKQKRAQQQQNALDNILVQRAAQ